jgi:hypothetical protein
MAFALTAAAETEVDVSGQIRVRTEFDDRLFGEENTLNMFTLMRTRLGIGATVDDNARFFVQVQDSRTLGGIDAFYGMQSGLGLNNTKNLDLHQAYLKVKRLWVDGLGLKLGRFEVAFGDERILGPVGWDNVGRSWEGGMLWYKAEKFTLKGMFLKALEFNAPFKEVTMNRDFSVYALIAKIHDPGLELFWVYEYDADTLFVTADDANDLDQFTIGGYYQNEVDQIDYHVNAAYQMGKLYDQYDISAYMFAGEVGYSFTGERPARVALGIDYASGDDGSDDEWNTYDNLYYTGHKFRGYMDYFLGSNTVGLIDLMGRGKTELATDWWLMGDFHWFRTAEEYGVGDCSCSDVGAEIDLSVKTKSVKGVDLTGGASFFFPKENFGEYRFPGTGFDPNTGMWLYYMFTLNFD